MGIFRRFTQNKAAGFIILAASITLIYFTFTRTRLTTNTLSRINTVERLVEKNTFALKTPSDSTPFDISIDHVKVGDNLYSSKPPTYPLVMAGESKTVKAVTGWNFFEHKSQYLKMLTLVNQVLPYILMLLMAFELLGEFTQDKWTRGFMLAALSFGMLPFGYAVTINNHTISAVLLFISFALIRRISKERSLRSLSVVEVSGVEGGGSPLGGALRPLSAVTERSRGVVEGSVGIATAIGLLSGFAGANDLLALPFLFLFLFLIFRVSGKLFFFSLVAMAIPFLVSTLVYYSVTGSMKPFYLQGKLYRYEGAYWTNPESLDAGKVSKGEYGFHIFFGHHGLFSITPLFLLVLASIPEWIRNKSRTMRLEMLGIFVCVIPILLFGLFRTTNYGGWCIGFRWFICFMPLFMLGAIPIVERLGKKWSGIIICLVLLLLSLPWNFEALWWEAFIRSSLETHWK